MNLKNYVIFSVNIRQEHKDNEWKKKLIMPTGWTNFDQNDMFYDGSYNGLAMITGEINNVIVIDIDNVEHWSTLLKQNKKKEPETVKVRSGSGGIHLYFKY